MSVAREQAFDHEALFYEGSEAFLEAAVPFIRQGLAREEAVLVAIPGPARIGALETALGDDAEAVSLIDLEAAGRNPARIIPLWREFLEQYGGPGRPARGIGEPIWAERTPAELVECQRHESLLNLAFADAPDFRLLCPYDAEGLDPQVLAEARRTHPAIHGCGVQEPSDSYVDPLEMLERLGPELSEPPATARRVTFTRNDLPEVRALVSDIAEAADFDRFRTADLVLAVSEVVTNSVRHGGGLGTMAIWRDQDTLICEVRDRGHISDPLVGRTRPSPDLPAGRGVWLANQICDLVQMRSTPGGSAVRVHQNRV